MKKHIEWEWFEDDTPVDLSEFENMSREELEAEISKLESEAIKERDRIRREEALPRRRIPLRYRTKSRASACGVCSNFRPGYPRK